MVTEQAIVEQEDAQAIMEHLRAARSWVDVMHPAPFTRDLYRRASALKVIDSTIALASRIGPRPHDPLWAKIARKATPAAGASPTRDVHRDDCAFTPAQTRAWDDLVAFVNGDLHAPSLAGARASHTVLGSWLDSMHDDRET